MINDTVITLHEETTSVFAINTGIKLGMADPIGPIQLKYFKNQTNYLAILKVLQSRYGKSKYTPSLLLPNILLL
jgi:3-hydroxybutyryl-CoA dehydrogenase